MSSFGSLVIELKKLVKLVSLEVGNMVRSQLFCSAVLTNIRYTDVTEFIVIV